MHTVALMPRPKGLQPNGDVIRFKRQHLGIKLSDFARNVHVSESHLGNVERGAMRISIESLARIARALRCPLEELINVEASSRPVSPRPPTHPQPSRPPRAEQVPA